MICPKPKTHAFIFSIYLLLALIIFSVVLLIWSYRFSIAAIDEELETAFSQRQTTAQSIIETQMEMVNLSMSEILDGPFLMEAVNNMEQARSTNLLIREMDASIGYGNLDIIFISYPGYPVWADASFSLFDVQSLLPDIAKLQIPRAGMVFKAPSSNIVLALKTIPIIHPDTGKVMGKIFGGFVLNDNLDLMELIRDKTQSTAVRFFSENIPMGSTEMEDSALNTIMSKHYAAMKPGGISPMEGVIASYGPLFFNGSATPVDIMFAISDTTYVNLKNRYRATVLIMFTVAVCFSVLSAWIFKRLVSPSLTQLLTYSDLIRAGKTNAIYKKGHIIELNEVGNAMEAMVKSLNQANREMDYLKNYLAHIIDSMPSVLVGINTKGLVTQWNKGAENATGLASAQALGRPLKEVYPRLSREIPRIEKALKNVSPITVPKAAHMENGEQRFEDITVYPLMADGMEGAVIRVDDVTEKIKMEEMMIQSERMLSVGGLAAGMAHEINNPLAGVLQNASLLSNRLSDTTLPANLRVAEKTGISMASMKDYMEERNIPRFISAINDSGLRMAAIVNNMLSFARKSDAQVSSHMISDLVDRTLDLAETEFDLKKHFDFKMIDIIKDYDMEMPPVPCESTKIQQVLLNIFRNGAQAMQEAGTKKPGFSIKTGMDKNLNTARLEIKDNGPGMDKQTIKRVFEPFFTTKSVGVGTGLGLSVSYFIITENHGGQMRVESSLGQGAKFIIHLPFERKTG